LFADVLVHLWMWFSPGSRGLASPTTRLR